MKKTLVLVLGPLLLFALEKVNLIRNAGFERDEVWIEETGAWNEPNPAEANAQDDSQAIDGFFSSSADTREIPTWSEPFTGDSAVVRQEFLVPKKISDLDSLCWSQLILLRSPDVESADGCLVGFTFADPERNGCCYGFLGFGLGVDDWFDITERILEDTTWHHYEKDLHQDFVVQLGVDANQELASFVLMGWGIWIGVNDWRGQKGHWDGIRLMGYADYDVGVKEILSGDSLEVGIPYQPVARIKNFGRENADSFLVMAEIWDGSSLIYVDTLPWTLEGDTEDTVTFADFDPPTTGPYTLTIRTHMTSPEAIDECDEDDEMSKEIGHSAITENPLPSNLSLEVRSIALPLQVSYSLPYGESGTLILYDASGRRIERMEVIRSGNVEFNSVLASGVYLVRLESKQATVTKKAVVLR